MGLLAADAYQKNKATKSAAKAQQKAAQEGIGLQREAIESFEARTDPFRELGVGAIDPLMKMIGTGSNPLLDALEEDVSRRIFANQAARGKLGSGETPAALGTALGPLRLQQQQQDFTNLFNLAGLGANVATGQGTAGMTSAGVMGGLMGDIGRAQAQRALGRGQAVSGLLGDVAGFAGAFSGMPSGFGGSPISGFGLGGGLPFSPTAGPNPFTV